jgi:hypothetical protein
MSAAVALKGTLFEQQIQATQAHALFLARSADAHFRHILKVLTAATLAVRYYQDVIFIPATEALRHTIRTVQMSEAEYASYNIESPFVRAKNHMAHGSNYNLSILSDFDGREYLFKMTKIKMTKDDMEEEQDDDDDDEGHKKQYHHDSVLFCATDMYERLV